MPLVYGRRCRYCAVLVSYFGYWWVWSVMFLSGKPIHLKFSDMEILFVSHKYPPATGGMEKQRYELIEGMRAHATVRKIVYTGEESYLQFFRKLNGRILTMIHRYHQISVIHFNDGLIATMSLWHVGYKHMRSVDTCQGVDVVLPLKAYQRIIFARFNHYDVIVAVSRATANAAISRGISTRNTSVN